MSASRSLITAEPETVGLSSARLSRIAPAMERYVASEVAGISVAIHRKGETVFADQYGFQDREAGTAMSPDTIFRLYSMTKPVVSAALMILFEEGLFRLDHPVAKFIPSFLGTKVMAADGSLVDPARPMTVAHLLTHTSGLTYDFAIDTPVAELYREARVMNDMSRPLADVIDVLAGIPLAAHPGEKWIYSVGIDVAARLIEVLADQPLHDFLQERIFGPLGMVDTGFSVPDANLGRLSAMYGLPDLIGPGYHLGKLVEHVLMGFNERIDVSDTYSTSDPLTTSRGGVGLFSTMADYLRFAQMLLNNGSLDGQQILGRKTVERMFTNSVSPELLPFQVSGIYRMGLGFGLGSYVMTNVGETGGLGSVGQHGWSGAAKTNFFVDPAEELTAVFMAQYMTGPETPDADFQNLVYQAIVD